MTEAHARPRVFAGEVLLESPRLWLRSMRAEDFAELHQIFTDPLVMAAFHAPPFTPDQMQGWLQRNLDHQRAHGFGLFSVLDKSTGNLIGNCGLELMKIDGVHVAELGYDFHSDHWNQGYATEAASVVRNFAVHELQGTRLISLIRIGNVASRRVAEKIGMRYAGEHNGDNYSYWQYELDQNRSSTRSI